MLVATLALLVVLGAAPSAVTARGLKPSPWIKKFGPLTVCLEEPPNHYWFTVQDPQNGRWVRSAQVTIANATGSQTLSTSAGFAGYDYAPTQTGTDQWKITATADGYHDAVPTAMTVTVNHCKWTLKLNYEGVFPAKKGFWTALEAALTPEIPLSIDKAGKVSGSGEAMLFISVTGSAPEVSCQSDNPVLTQVPVTIGGLVQKSTLFLTMKFDQHDFAGVGNVTCDVVGKTIGIMHLPLPGNTSILDKLGVNAFAVPTSGGSPSPPIPPRSTGLYWDTPLVGGQGRIEVTVQRIVETG